MLMCASGSHFVGQQSWPLKLADRRKGENLNITRTYRASGSTIPRTKTSGTNAEMTPPPQAGGRGRTHHAQAGAPPHTVPSVPLRPSASRPHRASASAQPGEHSRSGQAHSRSGQRPHSPGGREVSGESSVLYCNLYAVPVGWRGVGRAVRGEPQRYVP